MSLAGQSSVAARLFFFMTDSDIRRYNRILAQELGRHPNGSDPLFKWVRTRDLFYLIEAPVDMRTPVGIHMTVNGYRKITWEERLGTGWIIASWQSSGTEAQWKAQYGTVLPYPPQGMYFPIPNSHIPCDPNEDITMEVVAKIRQPLDEGFESILRRCRDEAEAQEQQNRTNIEDMIDSDWPAFDSQPMSKPYPKDKDITLQ